MSALDLPVLDVNCLNQAIGVRSVRDAITAMMGAVPAMAIDIDYTHCSDGTRAVAGWRPVYWDEWLSLPVRQFDDVIRTAFGLVRAPEVIRAADYNRMPLAVPKLTPRGIYERDNWTCQYTGRRLPQDQLNIDHVVPVDRGGRNTWENMVTCDRKINSWKGNRLNHEIGLRLLRKAKAPRSIPRCALIRRARRLGWREFLTIVDDAELAAA